jgi:hypothetical protein
MVQLLGEANYIDNVLAEGVDRRMGNIAPTIAAHCPSASDPLRQA